MTYTIWTRNGQSHPEFGSLARAKRYMRNTVLSASRLHTTDWLDDKDGQPAYLCCYGSLADLRNDQDGAYAPKIERRS